MYCAALYTVLQFTLVLIFFPACIGAAADDNAENDAAAAVADSDALDISAASLQQNT